MNVINSLILFSVLLWAADSERRDMYAGGPHIQWTQSVGLLFQDARTQKPAQNGIQPLSLNPNKFCKGEEFYQQKTMGFCSAVLISPQLVATASYCMEGMCPTTKLTFDFRADKDTKRSPEQLPEDKVYSCKEVISLGDGAAISVMRLNRSVEGVTPADIRLDSAEIPAGQKLTFYGHAHGLPLKRSRGIMRGTNEGGLGYGFYAVTGRSSGSGDGGGAIYHNNQVVGLHYLSAFNDVVQGANCQRWNDQDNRKIDSSEDSIFIPFSLYENQLRTLLDREEAAGRGAGR